MTAAALAVGVLALIVGAYPIAYLAARGWFRGKFTETRGYYSSADYLDPEDESSSQPKD